MLLTANVVYQVWSPCDHRFLSTSANNQRAFSMDNKCIYVIIN